MHRYFVQGWSSRYGMWIGDVVEANTDTQAKERFALSNPTLKKLKAWKLRNEMMG